MLRKEEDVDIKILFLDVIVDSFVKWLHFILFYFKFCWILEDLFKRYFFPQTP